MRSSFEPRLLSVGSFLTDIEDKKSSELRVAVMDVLEAESGQEELGERLKAFTTKTLPDDTVEYILCIIDQKLTDAALRSRLRDVQNAATTLTKKLLKDYIWQREAFKLDLVSAKDPLKSQNGHKSSEDLPGALSWTLRGQTNFGDNIADEWLIVYLLRELSKQFPDLWVRVADTDGEFLLIEAAGVLPKWLNPEIAENRVWINDRQLRIISNQVSPEPKDRKTLPGVITINQAVSFIASSISSLIHSPLIEEEAFFRLKEYPEAIRSSMHHALIRVPRRLAYILHNNAAYVSPAVEALYLRDQISTRPLETKDTATLYFPPEDFVTVSVKFNRTGFAQLRAQEYAPPPSWTAVRPHANEPKVAIGMKLACGFEMLLQDKQNQDKQAVREIKLLLEDVESGEDVLPNDEELRSWPQMQDDEKWLDINYEDLEKELSSKRSDRDGDAGESGFGDKSAQDNLRKMVSRFESFLDDDKAGVEGAEDLDDMDDDDDEEDEGGDDDSTVDSEGEDKDASYDEKEFEQAMREMMGMPSDEIEKSGLLDDARKLALDMEDEEEGERDDEEDVKKIMELMEKELRGHGALNLNSAKLDRGGVLSKGKGKGEVPQAEDEEDIGELSSDDELDDNDVDLGLLKNMMEAFKGQAGMSGPASNMMAAMGINMPRDEPEAEIVEEDDEGG